MINVINRFLVKTAQLYGIGCLTLFIFANFVQCVCMLLMNF
jgi:hypothetical protein